MHLAAGLSVGLTGLAAGYAIGVVGDVVSFYFIQQKSVGANDLQGVRSYMQQSRIFVGMVLILIFGEVLGLYGCANLPKMLRRSCLMLLVLLLLSFSTPEQIESILIYFLFYSSYSAENVIFKRPGIISEQYQTQSHSSFPIICIHIRISKASCLRHYSHVRELTTRMDALQPR